MFQRILVPLDGSEYAEAALPMAARIAQAGNGTVVLLHVLSSPREFLPYILPMMEPSTLTADVDNASAYLAAAAALPQLEQVTTITEVRSGLAGATILDVAADQHADLVVLATRAHTGLARWALGSVAEHVGRRGATPVLSLTNTHARPTEGLTAHGLVLLDGTMEAESAIAPAKELLAALSSAQHAGATLRLAWMGTFKPGKAAQLASQDDVSRYLRTLEERLRTESIDNLPLTVTSEILVGGDLHQAVANLAGEKQAAFIALAPHHQRSFPLHTDADFDVRLRSATKLPMLLIPRHATASANPDAQ